MNWEALSALSEVFGVIAVLVSLIYIGFEVRQSTRQARQSAQRDLVQELGQLSSCLTANSELASTLLEGANELESLDAIRQMQFRSYMNHLFALFEQQHLLNHEKEGDPETWVAVRSMMDDFLKTTGCKQWWQQRAHYRTRRFQAYVENRINELSNASD